MGHTEKESQQAGRRAELEPNVIPPPVRNKRGLYEWEQNSDVELPSSYVIAAETIDSALRLLKPEINPDSSYSHPDWEQLRGIRVLDLAAGSIYSHDAANRCWIPAFSRLCAVNGADVVAIDKFPQGEGDAKLFRGLSADLVDMVMHKGLEDFLHEASCDGRFDLINSFAFIGANPFPGLRRALGLNYDKFTQALRDQAFNLLNSGGVMTLGYKDANGTIFEKKD